MSGTFVAVMVLTRHGVGLWNGPNSLDGLISAWKLKALI